MTSIKLNKIQTWIALITVIILLGSTFVSAISKTNDIENKAVHNQEDILELKAVMVELANTQKSSEIGITILETQYSSIKEQLDRIENKIEVLQ